MTICDKNKAPRILLLGFPSTTRTKTNPKAAGTRRGVIPQRERRGAGRAPSPRPSGRRQRRGAGEEEDATAQPRGAAAAADGRAHRRDALGWQRTSKRRLGWGRDGGGEGATAAAAAPPTKIREPVGRSWVGWVRPSRVGLVTEATTTMRAFRS